ncbi:MAG: SH3 domain-containing protein [Anaerolineae bacterium]
MNPSIIPLFFIFLTILVPITYAQEDCPTIIKNALSTTDSACQTTGRNQACYGNNSLNVTTRTDAASVIFEHTGDIADVAEIESLRLSSLNSDSGDWGIALMNLQANLPNTLPGQNVRFLLFGDVNIENAGSTIPTTLEMTAVGNANVRQGPTTRDKVIATLKRGDAVTAVARLADDSWVQINLPDDSEAMGWVSAPLLQSTVDISTLDVFDATKSHFGPMQAFYFSTGIDDAPCQQAPDSGILIQTPKGAGRVNLVANEVNIQLGSTVYLQAQPGAEMIISVLEGHASVESGGVVVTVPAGSRARVPVDNRSAASGPPVGPESYLNADLAALPVGNLETVITIAPALTEAEIETAINNLLIPRSGVWNITNLQTDCSGSISREPLVFTFSSDGTTMSYLQYTLQRTGPGVYELDSEDKISWHNTWHFSTPESGEWETIRYVQPCSIHGAAAFAP